MFSLATIKSHISQQPPVGALLINISNTLQIFLRLALRVLCVLPQHFYVLRRVPVRRVYLSFIQRRSVTQGFGKQIARITLLLLAMMLTNEITPRMGHSISYP